MKTPIFFILATILPAWNAARAATITVSPTDDVQARLDASNAGDTVSFSAGTYHVANRMLLPGNRIYQGNGNATITGPDPTVASWDFDTVTGAEVTGFSFAGTFLQLHDCQVNIHGNTFSNTGRWGVYGDGMHDSHIDDNSFTGTTDTSVMLYPGNNNTVNGNTFDHINEAIHVIGGSYNDFSKNTINYCARNGIELQGGGGMTNLTVKNNWIGNWNPAGNLQPDGTASHMAISCATGSNPNGGAVTNQGQNNTISHNTLLLNGAPGQSAPQSTNWSLTGIELMGQQNIDVMGNYCSGAGNFIMNGTSNNSAVSSGNTLVVAMRTVNDNTPWKITPVAGTDTLYAWNDPNAPPAPSVAATVGSAAAAPVAQAIPAGINATPNGQPGQVAVACPAGSVLGIYASTLAPSTAVNLGTVSESSATIGGIPLNWRVTVTVTTGGTTYTLPAVQVLDSAIPSSGPFNPSLIATQQPAPNAAPAPSILEFQSVDGGKTITRTN